MSREKFGETLKMVRDEKGVTQFDCARNCGVSTLTYRLWEYGLSIPKEDNMEKLCKYLNMDRDEIECIIAE